MTLDPPLPAPFEWDGGHIVLRAPGGTALFMTKRADLRGELGLRWAEGHQVHEARVRRVGDERELAAAAADYDGQATSMDGVGCLVRTADCLPVALIADGAVAMVHAGWRGLLAGVLEEGVTAVRQMGTGSEVTAAIGPGIGACCYEVGPEVLAQFGVHAIAPALLDLKAFAAARLADLGVTPVHDVGMCTMCGDASLFHSYRRDATKGRQESFAWRS